MGRCFEIPGVCSTKRTRLYLGGVLSVSSNYGLSTFSKQVFIYPLYAIYHSFIHDQSSQVNFSPCFLLFDLNLQLQNNLTQSRTPNPSSHL